MKNGDNDDVVMIVQVIMRITVIYQNHHGYGIIRTVLSEMNPIVRRAPKN